MPVCKHCGNSFDLDEWAEPDEALSDCCPVCYSPAGTLFGDEVEDDYDEDFLPEDDEFFEDDSFGSDLFDDEPYLPDEDEEEFE